MYQNYHCNVILDELVKHIKSQKCCKETNREKSLYNNREACIYIDKKLDIKVLYFDKYFAIIFSAIFISCYSIQLFLWLLKVETMLLRDLFLSYVEKHFFRVLEYSHQNKIFHSS